MICPRDWGWMKQSEPTTDATWDGYTCTRCGYYMRVLRNET